MTLNICTYLTDSDTAGSSSPNHSAI